MALNTVLRYRAACDELGCFLHRAVAKLFVVIVVIVIVQAECDVLYVADRGGNMVFLSSCLWFLKTSKGRIYLVC